MADDLFPDAPIPLLAQIACVRREISMRQRVYPRWVESGRMTEEQSRQEIKGMYAVLDTLMALHEERM